MAAFLLRRLGFMILTLWLLTLIIFFAGQILPGDPGRAVLGNLASQSSVQALDHHHAYVRESSNTISAWMDRLVERHGVRHPELADVREAFAALARQGGFEAQFRTQALPGRELVFGTVCDVNDAKILSTLDHQRTRASRYPRNGNARAQQQLQAEAVERGKRPEFRAIVAVVELAVRQYAINVARQQTHAARTLEKFGRRQRPFA